MVRSAALCTEIMPRASTQQGLLFRKYKCILARTVNAENVVRNVVRQASRPNVSEGEDHNFFLSDSQFKPESRISNVEVRFVAYEFYSEFIHTLYFECFF